MLKVLSVTNKKGFSLVEALLTAALFSLAAIFVFSILGSGIESTALAGQRIRAVFLAEECMEAARNISKSGYNNLTAGAFGLSTTSNIWNLTGTGDAVGIYSRNIVISEVNTTTKQVVCTVNWTQNQQRSGSVVLYSHFTNWQGAVIIPTSCATYCQSLGYATGTCRRNNGACNSRGEDGKLDGDVFCTIKPNKTCCCAM